MNTKHLLLATCLLLTVLVHPALAGEPTERVRSLLNEVISIQSDPRLQGDEFKEKRRAAVKNIIGRNFDFDRMAERSLGEHWNKLDPGERAEFKEIFKDLFQDSYAFMVFENLKEEKILYEDGEVSKKGARVKTAVIRPYARILVDYELAPVKGSWLIGDVRIDGVSIVSNYRETFASVIHRESYEILLEKMRLKKEAVGEIP